MSIHKLIIDLRFLLAAIALVVVLDVHAVLAVTQRSKVMPVPAEVVSELVIYAQVGEHVKPSFKIIFFLQFSRAAYCESISEWMCGAACDTVPDFQVLVIILMAVFQTNLESRYVAGGGDTRPQYYIGFWPAKMTAVVVHEGTDPTHVKLAILDSPIT